MKAKEIKDLISFISDSGLEEVNIETDEIKLHIKRVGESLGATERQPLPTPQPTPPPVPQPAPEAPSQAEPQPAASPKEAEANYLSIKSPMIGTFYGAPNPESPDFVKVGDQVKEGQVVCIIEAMKLFNEIESEVSGKIVKILVENASPVEYDQPLFLVEPN